MDTRFLLLLVCFLLSGFSALLYQTAWMREFAFVFGTGGGTAGAPSGGPATVLQVGDRIYQTREVAQLAQQIAQSQRDQLGDAFDFEAAADQINEHFHGILLATIL